MHGTRSSIFFASPSDKEKLPKDGPSASKKMPNDSSVAAVSKTLQTDADSSVIVVPVTQQSDAVTSVDTPEEKDEPPVQLKNKRIKLIIIMLTLGLRSKLASIQPGYVLGLVTKYHFKRIKALAELSFADVVCQKRIAELGVITLLRHILVRDDYEKLAEIEAYDASRREVQDKNVSASNDSSTAHITDPRSV